MQSELNDETCIMFSSPAAASSINSSCSVSCALAVVLSTADLQDEIQIKVLWFPRGLLEMLERDSLLLTRLCLPL